MSQLVIKRDGPCMHAVVNEWFFQLPRTPGSNLLPKNKLLWNLFHNDRFVCIQRIHDTDFIINVGRQEPRNNKRIGAILCVLTPTIEQHYSAFNKSQSLLDASDLKTHASSVMAVVDLSLNFGAGVLVWKR
jgi:hypothetical protein